MVYVYRMYNTYACVNIHNKEYPKKSDEDDEAEIFDSDDEAEIFDSDDEIDYVEVDSDIDDELSESDDDSNLAVPAVERIYFTGKDGTQWQSSPYPPTRIPLHNVIRGGVQKVILPPGKNIESPLDAFSLFINDKVIQTIVNNTNLHGSKTCKNLWRPTDEIEIRCFIGLVINAGINKQGLADIREFWHPLFGNILFRASMSRHRFEILCQHIRFDDTATRSARRERDKFAPFRDIFDIINTNLLKHYIPGDNLTIDEQLIPFRGRCPFRQYIPSKPDKYGMKIWWICDSSNSYPLKGIPYLGKVGQKREINQASNVVEELCIPFHHTNRNITFDNYFTSLELAQKLLSVKLTCVGTLRKNKRCIPQNFLPNRHRLVESNIFGFLKNITLVSYVPKKSKAVILLSTMHHNNEVDPENRNKSTINLHYNTTKGGVDTLDQLCHAFSCKRKTNRWPMAQFYNIIDVTGVAAKVIWLNIYPDWNSNKKNCRRKLFLKEIVEELVLPNIRRRSTARLSNCTVSIMDQAISNSATSSTTSSQKRQRDQTTQSSSKRRCYMCPPAIGRMNKQICNICTNNVCQQHSEKILICKNCINK